MKTGGPWRDRLGRGDWQRARYASKCARCRKWIGVDMWIVVPKGGGGATHVDDQACAAAREDDPPPRPLPDAGAELAIVGALLDQAVWTFAKTMAADCPHDYSVRRGWADPAAFDRCVTAIRQLGERRRWRTMRRHYLDIGPAYFWIMETDACPASLVTLINRADRAARDNDADARGGPPRLPLEIRSAR